jgi:hypothetical protein
MKKVLLMATAVLMVTSLAFADTNDKGKRKKAKAHCGNKHGCCKKK